MLVEAITSRHIKHDLRFWPKKGFGVKTAGWGLSREHNFYEMSTFKRLNVLCQ
jgi:hypothetical protein